ncbi:MAG: 2TM domain-containing protein [Saprospiraceae bacterium]
MNAQQRNEYLRKRVRRRKKFYRHFGVYLIIVAFLLIMERLQGPANPPVYMVIGLTWGLAIALHFFRVFGLPGVGTLDEKWEEDEIRREHERLFHHLPFEESEERMDLNEMEPIHRSVADQSDFV